MLDKILEKRIKIKDALICEKDEKIDRMGVVLKYGVQQRKIQGKISRKRGSTTIWRKSPRPMPKPSKAKGRAFTLKPH